MGSAQMRSIAEFMIRKCITLPLAMKQFPAICPSPCATRRSNADAETAAHLSYFRPVHLSDSALLELLVSQVLSVDTSWGCPTFIHEFNNSILISPWSTETRLETDLKEGRPPSCRSIEGANRDGWGRNLEVFHLGNVRSATLLNWTIRLAVKDCFRSRQASSV